jgi:uroporphyrinogen-III decarboxylase
LGYHKKAGGKEKMSSREFFNSYSGRPDKNRFIKALRRQPVDRVPNFEVLIEDKHVEKMLGRYAGNTLAIGGDPAKGAGQEGRPMYPEDFIEVCEIIGQDMMCFEAGFWTPFKLPDAKGNLKQVIDKSIKDSAGFKKLVLDGDIQINNAVAFVKEYQEVLKKKDSQIGLAPSYGCTMQTLYEFVVGMNDFMTLAYEDLVLIEEMLEVSTVHFEKMTEALVEAGVDAIAIGDDVAFKSGLFLPPKLMAKIWLPRLARVIAPAVNKNIPVLFHSDGKIDDIVEGLISIGVDAITPLDPYAIDYRQYKKRYGHVLTFVGNVDIEFPLSKGTASDIEKDVREHMEVLKPGYGYIASCSHSIVNYIPHENFIAYINAIHKYGTY